MTYNTLEREALAVIAQAHDGDESAFDAFVRKSPEHAATAIRLVADEQLVSAALNLFRAAQRRH